MLQFTGRSFWSNMWYSPKSHLNSKNDIFWGYSRYLQLRFLQLWFLKFPLAHWNDDHPLEFGVGIQTTHYNWDISMQGTSQQSNPLVFGGLVQAWIKIEKTKKTWLFYHPILQYPYVWWFCCFNHPKFGFYVHPYPIPAIPLLAHQPVTICHQPSDCDVIHPGLDQLLQSHRSQILQINLWEILGSMRSSMTQFEK